eukprot:gene4117-7403_t
MNCFQQVNSAIESIKSEIDQLDNNTETKNEQIHELNQKLNSVLLGLSEKTTELLSIQQELLSKFEKKSQKTNLEKVDSPLKDETPAKELSQKEEKEKIHFSFPEPKPSIVSYFTGASAETSNSSISLDDFMNESSEGLSHIVNNLEQRDGEKKSVDYLDQMLDYKKKPEEMIKFEDEKKGSILGLFDDSNNDKPAVEIKTEEKSKESSGSLDDFF